MSELPSVNPWLDPSQKPYIQIENVTKKFGDFTAIDHLNLDIYKNDGKSTSYISFFTKV